MADVPIPSPAGEALAPLIVRGFEALAATVRMHEDELGRIDAVAGDGDHGRGMVKGADAALRAVGNIAANAGPGWLLGRAGRAWAAEAGGTSGVIWGAGLESAGRALGDQRETYTAVDAVAAVEAFSDAIVDLGRAELGDKTIVDAIVPFVDVLRDEVAGARPLPDAWRIAAAAAAEATAATAELSPKRGRARPLAAKSVGTPDAGATSFSLIVNALDDLLVR